MRQTLIALTCTAVLATACSSDDPADPGASFVGTYTTSTGTQSIIDCQFSKKTENLAITYTVVKGTDTNLTLTSSLATDCVLKANVVGTRATVIENQTCTRTDGSFKDTYTYATTSVIDITGPSTVKLEATFKRATLDGLDTGYTCGFTEESPITKK